jgi:hypothetical protein
MALMGYSGDRWKMIYENFSQKSSGTVPLTEVAINFIIATLALKTFPMAAMRMPLSGTPTRA